MDGTRSRSIGGTPRTNDASPGGARSHFDSAAEAATSTTTQGLAAVSLAEGLLTSLTNTNGWDVPEAWLFLGRVAARTDRAARARECLKYALSLEETKPIRPLAVAIQRGL